MKCCICNKPLIWESDFSYEEYGYEGEGAITILSCVNEKCDVESIKIYENYDKSRQ